MSFHDRPSSVALDLGPFLALFQLWQGRKKWKWVLDEAGRLRTWSQDGTARCPLLALGLAIEEEHFERTNRVLPGRPLEQTRLADSILAAVVHHADNLTLSRYWQPAFRRRLLEVAGIKERRIDRVYDRGCEGK